METNILESEQLPAKFPILTIFCFTDLTIQNQSETVIEVIFIILVMDGMV